MLKRKLKILMAIFFIIIFLTSCNLNRATSFIDSSLKHEISLYLYKNNVSLEYNEDSIADLSILDEDLNGKEIFFTGELHGVKANDKLRRGFLKYFKEKTDFTYYLCEMSYSGSYFLNKYLTTGDEKILKELYKSFKGTYEWNKDNYNHWKWLYGINQSLPQDSRIFIVGVDLEHQYDIAIRYLEEVIVDKNYPSELEEMIIQLKNTNYSQNQDDKLLEGFEELQATLLDREIEYKEALGEDYAGIALVVKNAIYRNEAYSTEEKDFNKIRDKRIFENFKEINSLLPKGKYYGQWGLNHIFQGKQLGVNWFGALLNQSSDFRDKIISIGYSYDNCTYMSKGTDGNYSEKRIDEYKSQLSYFDGFVRDQFTLFKLNGEASPFSKYQIWPYRSGSPKEGTTTAYIQYLVVIRDSTATEPLNIN